MNKYRVFMDETLKKAETPEGLLQEDSESFAERLERRMNLRGLLFGLTLFAVGIALGYYLGAREAAALINELLAR